MLKIEIEDFIFEMKDEILSYEELGQEYANKWEKNFLRWLEDDSIKKKNIKKDKNQTYYVIGDESEIFDMADGYYYAVTGNQEDNYWKNFK